MAQGPKNQKSSLGIVALQRNLIDQKQLMECLNLQRASGPNASLEQMLIRKGYLTVKQIEDLTKISSSSTRKTQDPKKTGVQPNSSRTRPTAASKPVGTRPAGSAPRVRKQATGVYPTSGETKRPTRKRVHRSTEIRPAVPSPGTKRESGRSTRGSMRPNTQAMAPSPSGKNRTILLGGLFAGIPVLLLLGYLILRPEAPPVQKTPDRTRETPEAKVKQKPTPIEVEEPLPATDLEAAKKIRLYQIRDNSDLARRWNQIVDSIGRSPKPVDTARTISSVQMLVPEAKGTPHETQIIRSYRDMIRQVHAYAEEMYEFIAEQADSLAKAGKYADAVNAWDWFPSIVDPNGIYEDRISATKSQTREKGMVFYGTLKSRAQALVQSGKYEEARRVMMTALEIGFPQITEEAYEEIASLSDLEHKASREAEARAIEEYEAEIREQKEASSIVETMRARFWLLVSQRKRDAVASFLRSEKAIRTGDPFESEFELLDKVLSRIDALFKAVGNNLASKRGRSVTLSFLDQVRTFRLKDIRDGKIVRTVDGRELTESLWQLHEDELLKFSGSNSLNQATAHLMADEFDEALSILRDEGQAGETLSTFIERSGSYVAKNADKIRDKARAHEREGDYEKAIRAWSKLASVPELRKEALLARANAYYESQNFVAAVFDVEQLFEMNVVTRKAIDILNQSYERSALITKAVSIYEKAAQKMPEDPKILGALVSLYMKIHEYGKARTSLEQAKKLKGWDDSLGGPIHLLNIAEQGAFSGKSYKIPLGRYVVETNVDQPYTNEIASFMGGVYKMYEKVFPYKKNENLRFYVKIFRNESEFQTYFKRVTGQDAASGAGKVTAYYMPITKELVGWKGSDLKNTLQHEGLHQFIDFYVDDCPMWFNEGFACIFETSTADRVSMNRERHMLAKAGISRKMTSLRDLLLMSRQEWNSDSNRTVFYYGISWSFIYYLVKQGKRDMLDKYFEELMKGRTRKQAFDAVFGPGKVNLGELEAKWKLAVFNDQYE